MLKRVCVVDGQGGGIGAAIIKALRYKCGEALEIWALGTNAIATSQMMKAGANRGATGENAVVRAIGQVDVILGPVSITWANAMLGELTPGMAQAVTSTPVPKILLPLSQENIALVGVSREPLPHLVEEIITLITKEYVTCAKPMPTS